MKHSSEIFDITALCYVICLSLHIFPDGKVVSAFTMEA